MRYLTINCRAFVSLYCMNYKLLLLLHHQRNNSSRHPFTLLLHRRRLWMNETLRFSFAVVQWVHKLLSLHFKAKNFPPFLFIPLFIYLFVHFRNSLTLF